jgi:integrase
MYPSLKICRPPADALPELPRDAPQAPEHRPANAPPADIGELIDWFARTHPSPTAAQRLGHFRHWAGTMKLAEIDEDLLIRYVAACEGLKAWTLHGNIIYARAALRAAVQRGWLDDVPRAPHLPPVVHNPRGIGSALGAVLTYLATLPRSRYALRILGFIAATGCRPGEARNLRWEDFDPDKGTFILAKHKTASTGLPRTIYMTPESVPYMPPRQSSGPVFLSSRGKPYSSAGLRIVLRRASLASIGKAVTPYQLRHTFAQNARRQLQPDVLMVLMGHQSLSTTMIYYRIEDEHALAAAAGLHGLA